MANLQTVGSRSLDFMAVGSKNGVTGRFALGAEVWGTAFSPPDAFRGSADTQVLRFCKWAACRCKEEEDWPSSNSGGASGLYGAVVCSTLTPEAWSLVAISC